MPRRSLQRTLSSDQVLSLISNPRNKRLITIIEDPQQVESGRSEKFIDDLIQGNSPHLGYPHTRYGMDTREDSQDRTCYVMKTNLNSLVYRAETKLEGEKEIGQFKKQQDASDERNRGRSSSRSDGCIRYSTPEDSPSAFSYNNNWDPNTHGLIDVMSFVKNSMSNPAGVASTLTLVDGAIIIRDLSMPSSSRSGLAYLLRQVAVNRVTPLLCLGVAFSPKLPKNYEKRETTTTGTYPTSSTTATVVDELPEDPEDLYQMIEQEISTLNNILDVFISDNNNNGGADGVAGEEANGSGNDGPTTSRSSSATPSPTSFYQRKFSMVAGNVVIADLKGGWAFTLEPFAKGYLARNSKEERVKKEDKNAEQQQRLQGFKERLWGDRYFDSSSRSWKKSPSENCATRSFVEFCLKPLYALREAVIEAADSDEKERSLQDMVEKLSILRPPVFGVEDNGVEVPVKEPEFILPPQSSGPRRRFEAIMCWLFPASETLLEAIAVHLPSPIQAQNYRAEILFSREEEGKEVEDLNSLISGEDSQHNQYNQVLDALKRCDSSKTAPMVAWCGRMCPTSDKGRFLALCRVFSGSMAAGQRCSIMGPNFTPGKKVDLFQNKTIQRVVTMIGPRRNVPEALSGDVPAGSLVLVVGIDKYLVHCGCVVQDGLASVAIPPFNAKRHRQTISPVVKVLLDCTKPADLPKLVEGLKRLAKSEPAVQCEVLESGSHCISATTYQDLQLGLTSFHELTGGLPIKVHDCLVSLRETVTTTSATCHSVSPNKHNKLYCNTVPMAKALCEEIEDAQGSSTSDINSFAYSSAGKEGRQMCAKRLVERYNWHPVEAQSIWSFSPEGRGANVFLNLVTKETSRSVNGNKKLFTGDQNEVSINEIKDSTTAAWQWVAKEGPLCEAQMRGVRIDLTEATLHTDAIHRGAGQIIPTMRRAMYGTFLSGQPRLLEPIYSASFVVPACDTEEAHDPQSNYYTHTLDILEELVVTVGRGQVVSKKRIPRTKLVEIEVHIPAMECQRFQAAVNKVTQFSSSAPPTMQSSYASFLSHHTTFSHWEELPGDPSVEKLSDPDADTLHNFVKGEGGARSSTTSGGGEGYLMDSNSAVISTSFLPPTSTLRNPARVAVEHLREIHGLSREVREAEFYAESSYFPLDPRDFESLLDFETSQLPDGQPPFHHDLLEKVFFFIPLDFKTVMSVSQVCSSWRFLSNYLPHWKYMQYRDRSSMKVMPFDRKRLAYLQSGATRETALSK